MAYIHVAIYYTEPKSRATEDTLREIVTCFVFFDLLTMNIFFFNFKVKGIAKVNGVFHFLDMGVLSFSFLLRNISLALSCKAWSSSIKGVQMMIRTSSKAILLI